MTDQTDGEMLDQDLDQPATRRDLRAFDAALRTEIRGLDTSLRDEIHGVDTSLRDEIRGVDTSLRGEIRRLEERMDQRFDELRTHFALTAENFRSEFRNLYDWTVATASALDARLGHVEKDHGSRLLSVETRVTRLERRRKSSGR